MIVNRLVGAVDPRVAFFDQLAPRWDTECSHPADTLRRLTDVTADLVFLDLPRRVAKVLLGQPRAEDGTIRLRLNQEELAHQVGSTRQSVNAALRGFERRGWIRVRERVVTVQQEAALSRFAQDQMSAS